MTLPVRLIAATAAASITLFAAPGTTASAQTPPSTPPDMAQQARATTAPGARGEDPHYPNKTDMSAGRTGGAMQQVPMQPPMHRNDAAGPNGARGSGMNGGG
ncbi:hypothetical protein [Burkholderia plantarii]|uniref:hypothetical protein n=1 Tax=Burkholderia plantarii TaxID=41899 RepID=UPI0005AF080A|nr:hypothetical protein [Burkholderia plantarii]WLE63326.1 hypothetical protein GIY62_23765 [Burkholderia plantarii]GLZ20584.1 hypothetical protein Bpla01_41130 [Burkholderia plantarii]